MTRRSVTRLALAAGLLTGIPAGLGACAEDPEDPLADESPGLRGDTVETAPETGRMGQIHVVVQPRTGQVPVSMGGDPAAFRASARFAEYRGFGRQEARVRADMPLLALEVLSTGDCTASADVTGRLSSFEAAGADEGQELLLLDAGDLRLSLAGREQIIPLALVPDLVPWVSGVEYAVAQDQLPTTGTPLRRGAAMDGTLDVEGSGDGTVPGFSVPVTLPPAFELLPAVEDGPEGALHLAWEPPDEDTGRLVLELQALENGRPIGEQVSCVVPDLGRARMDMATLDDAGLGNGNLVRVTARRLRRRLVRAGAFDPVEVLTEQRDQQLLPMPE